MQKITIRSGDNGLGFGSVLLLIFITLKLTGHITWSWFWVLSPIWIPFLLVVLVFLIWFMIFVVGNKK